MPNIEIHGFAVERKAQELEGDIFKAFSEKSYVHEIVVTRFSTVVTDKRGILQPFLRLVNTRQEHTKEIIGILKQFGLDIEHVRAEAFYPKLACKADDCGGELDFSVRVPLTGTSRNDIAYACKECKRVYREDGSQILSHGTHEVFFKNGELVRGSAVEE